MCGVAGWFSSIPESPQDHARLARMSSSIKHRGPDQSGAGVFGAARFAHVRLSIIDVDHGEQPFVSTSGKSSLIFNGEIYNYQSLRDTLQNRGIVFKSRSDTEVIVNLYELEGTAAFSMLRGMFSIALWDNVQEQGYLVRDSNGIKPLFYHQCSSGELYFGSEAKAILAAKTELARLDESTLHQVMNFRYIPGQGSLLKNIRQLAPGTIMTWRDGKSTSRNFEPAIYNTYSSLRSALEDSVSAHVIADVSVGSYLSGGVDSALISSLASKHIDHRELKTFTMNVGDDPLEADNAKASAILLDLSNICADAGEVGIDAFRRLIWHLEVPKINAMQVQGLSNLASQHVKVVLSGLGADELFSGYNVHQLVYLLEKLRFSGLPLEKLLRVIEPSFRKSQDFWSERYRGMALLGKFRDLPGAYALLRNVWDSPVLRSQIYGPRMLDSPLADCHQLIRDGMPSSGSYLKRVMSFERKEKLVNDLLWQEDRCSMAVGLETRVPFVDSQLSAYMAEIEPGRLMPKGRKKYLLKAMAAEVLPQQILNRRKSGFQVDSPSFFLNSLGPLAKQYLNPQAVREAGLFNPLFIETVKKLPPRKKYRWHFFMLYLAIGAHVWLEIFEGRSHEVQS